MDVMNERFIPLFIVSFLGMVYVEGID